MTFVSLAYAVLLPIVFLLAVGPLRRHVAARNGVLLAASYLFYAWWDWRFAGLLLFSTAVAWACALPGTRRRVWAAVSVTVNLAILVTFKYLGFFAENLRWLLQNFGWEVDWFTIEILLPIGISFYTFQAVGYSIDVACGRVQAERNPLTFALFIAFFPQLVAGPIESASRMLPQFRSVQPFSYPEAVEGMRRILWGLFKKVVVADGVAPWIDAAFRGDVAPGTGGAIASGMAVWLFLIQIYADFSGYCDIARGSAQLLGFRLSDNFLFPLFSRNAREMWSRWHRSLMEWFRTYVYIPMGGSRKGNRSLHVMAVFLLSGLWHGAEWTFVIWGALGGLWVVLSVRAGCANYRVDGAPATRQDALKIVLTCAMMAFAFAIFRAESMQAAITVLQRALPCFAVLTAALLVLGLAWRRFGWKLPAGVAGLGVAAVAAYAPKPLAVWCISHLPWLMAAVMLAVEWNARDTDFGLSRVPRNTAVRIGVYVIMCMLIFTGAVYADAEFIYFRF